MPKTETEPVLELGDISLVSLEGADSDAEPLETSQDDSPTITAPIPTPRGGVRKDGGIPGTTKLDRYTPVPAPRYRKFLSTAENPHQNSRAAWKYWMALPDWAKGQIDAYVYRDHPILLEPPLNDEGKPKYLSSIDKIPGGSPITDDLDLLNRYGCGSYHVYLSETASTKRGDKSICQIWVQNVGSNNYRSNPPTDSRVTDVEQVDLDHPANKAYISYLRAEGRLPEQVDGKLKEHEMATVEAVKEVTTQQGVLVKEIIGMARERGQNSENASKAQAEVMADTIKTSNEMTREAAKQSIGMVKDAFDQAKAMLPTAATPVATENPMAMALEIVRLIREERTPAQGSDARYDALQAQLAQLQQSQIDRLSKQVETLLDAKVTGPAASTSPFSAMDQGLDSLQKFNDVMTRLKGNKEDEGEDAVVDAVADAAPKWLRPVLPFIPGLAQGAIAWFNARQQQPQPTYYQTADGRILPIAIPQVMPPQQQQIQAAPRPQQQFGPQPVPSPTPNPTQDPIYELLNAITIPLLNNLQVNGTGTDFADWFIGGFGQDLYDQVSELGPDTLFTAISTFPPISTNSIYVGKTTDQVHGFISEFCDPKWPDGDEGEGESGVTNGKVPESGPVPT